MAIKKRKKGGKKGIQYYGKASDGYDPQTQDSQWERKQFVDRPQEDNTR